MSETTSQPEVQQVSLDELWLALPDFSDPYPAIRRFREESPVYRAPDGSWFVTPYDLVSNVVRTPSLWASNHRAHGAGAGKDPYLDDPRRGTFSEVYRSVLMFQDGDAHKRLRLMAQPIFTPRTMEVFRGMVGAAIESQLDEAIAGAGATREMDFRASFTLPMPNRIILDLFGIPQEEAYRFFEMADLIVPPLDRGEPSAWLAQADTIYERHMEYILSIAQVGGSRPSDSIVSKLYAATDSAGDRLTDVELAAFVSFLVVAGYETTANTFTSGIYWLLRNPDQLAALKQNPSLIPQTVEEILRYDPATRNAGPRFATEDTVLGGERILKGDKVLASIHGANRDPDKFSSPDSFDISRDPNPHVSFISGPHGCLGKPLARLEMQEGLRAVLVRMPHLSLAGVPEVWHRSRMIRGLDSLSVTW